MFLFDAPSMYVNGEFISDHRTLLDRPKMNQISASFIPDHYLGYVDPKAIRGQILGIFLCEDGLVVISVLPRSLYDKTRD